MQTGPQSTRTSGRSSRGGEVPQDLGGGAVHYDQSWMGSGIVGGLEAGAISMLVALLLFLLLHRGVRRLGWSCAQKIGWSFLLACLLTVSGDLWDMLYLNYSNLQSPALLTAVLAEIHDPEHLGMRVLCELLGVSLGVYLGWVLSGGYHVGREAHRHS
ncbi:MAG: hypothetical protein ABI178_10355 [Rhodanobacter sp.]